VNTTIIAEIGSCHENSILKAKLLIENAKECGADVAKFQYYSSSEELAQRRNAPELAAKYEAFRMPREWLDDLKEHCNHADIEFMCTCYLPQDIELINKYVDRFKISSFEAQDVPFVRSHAQYKKPILVSCGMTETQLDYNGDLGCLVYRLHCVSGYPTPLNQANIGTISEYKCEGYSDHTVTVQTGALAVAAGAFIIEKHIKLKDTDLANPDYPHSLVCDTEASSFEIYCCLIRDAEDSLGDGHRKIQECEKVNLPYRRVKNAEV